MARYFGLLTTVAAATVATIFQVPSVAQTAAPAASAAEKPMLRGNRFPGGPFQPERFPQMDHVRKALEGMTPEQRRRLGENLLRWSNLPPEQKKALGEQEEMRKRIMEKEISAAIAECGLNLEGERRVQFIRRFGEERKKIEEQLQREAAEKRKPMVRELIGRMKAEFSTSNP